MDTRLLLTCQEWCGWEQMGKRAAAIPSPMAHAKAF